MSANSSGYGPPMVRVTRDVRLKRLGLLQRDLALLLGVTPLTISRRLAREEAGGAGAEGDRTIASPDVV